MAGGKQVPILLKPYEKNNGYVLFQAVDFTAAHPSGQRKSYRRGQRVWATDDAYPANYKAIQNDKSLIVLHLAIEMQGGDFVGYPLIHCAPWRHMNKDRCNVSRFVLALKPQQVKEAELHVCPPNEEDKHHAKFTNVSHSTFMVELCKNLAARLAAVDIGDDSNADELVPAER